MATKCHSCSQLVNIRYSEREAVRTTDVGSDIVGDDERGRDPEPNQTLQIAKSAIAHSSGDLSSPRESS